MSEDNGISPIDEGLSHISLSDSGVTEDSDDDKKISLIRKTLLSKTHSGFNLDDILHHFREVFLVIKHFHRIPVSELKATYSTILSQQTYTAFTNSYHLKVYMLERFNALIKAHSITKIVIFLSVDQLITSNRFRRAKVNGLLRLALQHLGIDASEMVFVSNDLTDDIVPVDEHGILAVGINETEEAGWDFNENDEAVLKVIGLRFKSLAQLENTLRS